MDDHRLPLEILKFRLIESQIVNEADQLFVPNGALEQILDRNTVGSALSELSVSHGQLLEGYTCKICDNEVPFRKILALLLLINAPEEIIRFLDHGIDDLALPMPDPKFLDSCDNKDTDNWRKWRSLASSGLEPSFLQNIYTMQWRLLAPSFSRRDVITHYAFTHDHILPFIRDDNYSEVSHPPNEGVRYGLFSQVRRVKIHPKHCDFGDYEISNPNQQFAVKELYTPDYENFAQEVEVFKRYWRSHIHIIPLLATFEIQETVMDDPIRSYCLIFPWAAGDLNSFWESNDGFVGRHDVIPWILRECYEITRALSYIHGDANHPDTVTDSFGRHGDIRPPNILWFPDPPEMNPADLGKLVLADFGLTKFHRATSRTSSRASSFPVSTTYRAPEFDTGGTISQGIDIWALGCMFLEFVTWFLKGSQTVKSEFNEYRLEADTYGIHADVFFRLEHHDNHNDIFLKPQVVDWIKKLSAESCDRYLNAFLDIIQSDMLVVDPMKRATAGGISWKLDILQLRCANDTNGYQATRPTAESLPTTPNVPVLITGEDGKHRKSRMIKNWLRRRVHHAEG